MNKILAIEGHPTLGGEVMDILTKLGGENVDNLKGNNEGGIYYIDPCTHNIVSSFSFEDNYDSNYTIEVYTLERFKNTFRINIGDHIRFGTMIEPVATIEWNEYVGKMVYTSYSGQKLYLPLDSKSITKIDFDKGNYSEEVELVLGDNHEVIEKDGKLVIVKKKFPYTYKECCEVLGITHYGELMYDKDDPITQYENELIDKLDAFRKLIICRDAYWKVLNWKPDWTNFNEHRYLINYNFSTNEIEKYEVIGGPYVLIFPDESTADIFIKKFGDLIEKCKEWL